jgi:hypothetical protein
MIVAVPMPISCVPHDTTTLPEASMRARAEAGARCAGYVALAMPIPISQRPSRVDRGTALRRDHPIRSAPC